MVKDVSKVQSNENIETRSKQRDWTPRDIVKEKGHTVITDCNQQSNIMFVCNECEAVYRSRNSLSKHMKLIHEGVKYNCNQCDSTFTQQSNLTTHLKSVHEGVKYDCHQCDYRATQQGSLTRHVQSLHE